MARANTVGVVGLLITGGTLSDSRAALEIAESRSDCFATCGVHPTRCNEFEEAEDPEVYLALLTDLAKNPKILAVGECGIDYSSVLNN